jgi:hypothetical protein
MIFLSKNEKSFEINDESMRIFSSIFPPDVNISERQAQALAHSIRVNGTGLLKHAQHLFLWNNLTNSILVIKIFKFGFYLVYLI